ncbi:MAG: transcription-repair coupling factor [bacterium]
MKEIFQKHPIFQKLVKQFESGNKSIFIGGVSEQIRAPLYAFISSQIKKNIIIITSAEYSYRLYDELDSLKNEFETDKNVIFYPEDDSIVYKTLSASREISKLRAAAYKEIFAIGHKVFVTDINAVAEKIDAPENVIGAALSLKKGMKIAPEKIQNELASNNYSRVLKVENAFEYSVRGSIIDIYSPDFEYPVRIEFFGDEIESLRFFSIETYSTTKVFESIELFIYNPGGKTAAASHSILDYFDHKDTVIIIDGQAEIKKEILEKISKIEMYSDSGSLRDTVFSLRSVFTRLSKFKRIRAFSTFLKSGNINIKSKLNPVFHREISLFFGYLKGLLEAKVETFISSDNEGEKEHIKKLIDDYLKDNVIKGKERIKYIISGLSRGCEVPEINAVIITNREVFERYAGGAPSRRSKRKLKDKNLRPVRHYLELKEGDCVVHNELGIGIFEGIKTLDFDDVNGDFIVLKYAGTDKLYLPVYKIDLIEKYIGGEAPALSKFNSPIWRRTKEEIKAALRLMAQELLNIYAQRQLTTGIKFAADDDMQKAFEEAFVYDETPDQAAAIVDVKHDMESRKQMDRLVCGDAGFGKTEVAMRAAFKTVNFGKQAVVVTATTLLAQQHYRTFKERMADYPIKIKMISRLVKPKDRKITTQALKDGTVDILIGTHAILNDRTDFLDLGLVIIDEEQHFGVKHKEFLRKKYPQADILTLTATPIPRTLYFSLSGIRDISTINTPPVAKKVVETYIIEEKMATVKEIILREVLRKGQVFYIFNNVQRINSVKEVLEKNLPEVRFRYAHGQMEKQELENIMMDFIEGKFDVLISTTIVESGLDLPNVNTIIISSSDRFGLSQLYQLRGRVGRRDRQAYAYLMVKDAGSLSEAARERLRTIESYVDPGAGFDIAMKDIELRGAGSVFGTKQHGNMEKIGFEMYCKLLEQAVAEYKGETIEDIVDTNIKIDLKAFIPEDYMWDSSEKLKVYRALFFAKEEEDIQQTADMLKDVWGEYPQEVENILFVSSLKVLGRKLKVNEIIKEGARLSLVWNEKMPVAKDKLGRFLTPKKGKVRVSVSRLDMLFENKKQILEWINELV